LGMTEANFCQKMRVTTTVFFIIPFCPLCEFVLC